VELVLDTTAALLRWLRIGPAQREDPRLAPHVGYHEARARQERSLARRATCPVAREVHLSLAAMHRRAEELARDPDVR
jgi:hypothetical protein